MTELLRVLLVEDSAEDADLLIRELKKSDFDIVSERVQTARDMTDILKAKTWDIIFSDFYMPSFDAFEALSILNETKLDIPFVIISGTIGEQTAVAVMRAGAQDFLIKGKFVRLIPVLHREIKDARDRKQNQEVKRELEEKDKHLRQSQKMEAIGNLAGGIAHDFNNILTVILLEAERGLKYLNANLITPKTEQVSKSLVQIKKSGERAASLTRQLLAFGRKQVIQPVVSNPNALVHDMEQMLNRLIRENITLQLDLDKEIKNIKVDVGHFEQVIINLVVNARDAMPNGGILKISTENGLLPAELAQRTNSRVESYTILNVTDNGLGIDEVTIGRIFEPFFTTKDVGNGTGLGLSTVFGIIKQNNGFITVDSKPNKGAEFKVYFPQVDQEVAISSPSSPNQGVLHGNETILVAEDEEVLREIVCEVLTSQGYNVLRACDGAEALKIIQTYREPIHLVVTDAVMPNMGGWELYERAKQIKLGFKFLFLSGYTEDALIRQGIDGGHISFLEKPYTTKDLLTTVRSILDSEKNTVKRLSA